MSVPTGQDLARKYLTNIPTPTKPSIPSTAAPAKEEDDGPGILGQALGGVGKTLGLLNKGLAASNTYGAVPALGVASKLVASDTPVGQAYRTMSGLYRGAPKIDLGPVDLNPFMIVPPVGAAMKVAEVLDTENDEQRVAVQKSDSFTQAWREASGSDSFTEQMIAEVLADPTTWITLGTAGVVEKVPFVASALLRSQQTSGKLFNAWSKAKIGISALEEAQALPITGIPKLARGSVNTVRRIPGKEDFLRPTGAKLTDLTAQAKLKISNKNLDQAMRNFLSRMGSTTSAVPTTPSTTAVPGAVYTPSPRIAYPTGSGQQPWMMTQEEFITDRATQQGYINHDNWLTSQQTSIRWEAPEVMNPDGTYKDGPFQMHHMFDDDDQFIVGYMKDNKLVYAAEVIGTAVRTSYYDTSLTPQEVANIGSALSYTFGNPNIADYARPISGGGLAPGEKAIDRLPNRHVNAGMEGAVSTWRKGHAEQGTPNAVLQTGINDVTSGGTRTIIYADDLGQAQVSITLNPTDMANPDAGYKLWGLYSNVYATPREKIRAVNGMSKYMQNINITSASDDLSQDSAPFVHRWLVKEAVEAGDPVPEHVLADYPGLKAKAEKRSSFDNVIANMTGTRSNTAGDTPLFPMNDQRFERNLRALTSGNESIDTIHDPRYLAEDAAAFAYTARLKGLDEYSDPEDVYNLYIARIMKNDPPFVRASMRILGKYLAGMGPNLSDGAVAKAVQALVDHQIVATPQLTRELTYQMNLRARGYTPKEWIEVFPDLDVGANPFVNENISQQLPNVDMTVYAYDEDKGMYMRVDDPSTLPATGDYIQIPIHPGITPGPFRDAFMEQLVREHADSSRVGSNDIAFVAALTDEFTRALVASSNDFPDSEAFYSILRTIYESKQRYVPDKFGQQVSVLGDAGIAEGWRLNEPDGLAVALIRMFDMGSDSAYTNLGREPKFAAVFAHEFGHIVENFLPDAERDELRYILGATNQSEFSSQQREIIANSAEKWVQLGGLQRLTAENIGEQKRAQILTGAQDDDLRNQIITQYEALFKIYDRVAERLAKIWDFIRVLKTSVHKGNISDDGASDKVIEFWDRFLHRGQYSVGPPPTRSTTYSRNMAAIEASKIRTGKLAPNQALFQNDPNKYHKGYLTGDASVSPRTAASRNMTPITPDQDDDTLWQRFLASGVNDTLDAREYFDLNIKDIRDLYGSDPIKFEEAVLDDIDTMVARYPSPLGSVMNPNPTVTAAPTPPTPTPPVATAAATALPTDWTDMPSTMTSVPAGAERRVVSTGGRMYFQYRAIPAGAAPTPPVAAAAATPTPPTTPPVPPTAAATPSIPGAPKTSNFDRTSPLNVKNLVGSQSRMNVLRTLGDLNGSTSAERTAELTDMSKPYLEEVWQAIDPAEDEAYPDVRDFMVSKGYISVHPTPGRIDAKDTLTTAAPTNWTTVANAQLTLDLADVVKRGDVVGLEAILNRRNNKTARLRAVWELVDPTNPKDFLDPTTRAALPTTMLEDALKKRGLITPVGAGENVLELPRFARSVASSRASGAIPRADAAPAADATVDEVLAFRGRELGVTPTPQMSATIKRGAELNPEHFSARLMWQDPRVRTSLDQALQATDPKQQQRHIENMFFAMNMQNSAFGVSHPSWAKFRRTVLPTTAATKDKGTAVIFGKNVHNAVIDDADVAELSEAFQMRAIQEFQATYDKDREALALVLNKYAAGPRLNDWTTARELIDALDKNIVTDAADRKKLEAFLKRYDMTEEAANRMAANAKKYRVRTKGRALDQYTVEEAYLDKLLSAHFTAKAKELNINLKESDAFFLKQLGWIPKAWREQALLSIRYHLANTLDMTIKSMIYGINPLKNMGAQSWAALLESQMPMGAYVGKDSRTLATLIDNPSMQGVEEFLGEDAPTAWGAVPGVRIVADPVVRFNRRFARATDNAFREWAWANGSKDRLLELRPQLDTDIRRYMPGKSGADLLADIEKQGDKSRRSAGIEFSANKLRDMARARGASTEAANALADTWQRAIDDASRHGVDMSNKVHFDYSKTYNIEDKLFLRKILPFHFFATRNLPFYLETLAANPVLVNTWQAYQDVSEQDRIDMGLPSTYKGMVLMDGFLEGIFGPGKIFVNPLSTFSVFDTFKNLDRATAESTGDKPEGFLESVGQPIKRLSGIGLGVAPWVNIPLSMAGFYGPEDEQLPVLRHSGLVQAATGDALGLGLNEGKGYDLGEQKFRDFQAWARSLTTGEKVTTHTGSIYTDRQIVNKIAENAIQMSEANPQLDQKAIRDLFEGAAKEGPGNAIWDDAAKDVRQVEASRALSGFWFPLPEKATSEQGVEIMKSTSGSAAFMEKYGNNKAFKRLAQNMNSPLTAYTGYQRPRATSTFGGESGSGGGEAYDPSQLSKWGGTIWGPDKASPYNNLLIMWEYLMWLDYQPEGARSPEEFFAQYNIM